MSARPLFASLFAVALLLAGPAPTALAQRQAPARAQRAPAPQKALPAVSRTPTVTRIRTANPRIEAYRQKHLSKDPNAPATAAKTKREAKLAKKAAKLARALGESKDQRPILVILEGPDGAGKSSTIRRMRLAFDPVYQVREVHFGKPPENEPGGWLARYKAEFPKNGEVAIWDRSYYGRTVYDPYMGMVDGKTVKARYKDIVALEKQMAKDFRVVKIYLDAGSERLAETLGKREAHAPEKLSEGDYQVYQDRKQIRGYFKDARKATGSAIPWRTAPMDSRSEGREVIMSILRKDLL